MSTIDINMTNVYILGSLLLIAILLMFISAKLISKK